MTKHKKKYNNLRWFNLELVTKYKILMEDFQITYKEKNKINNIVMFCSRVKKNKLPKIIYIVQRTSKNYYKVLEIIEDKAKNKNFGKAIEVLEYIKNSWFTYLKGRCFDNL